MAFSFALADKAAAQQISISYSAEPEGLVSVNAEGRIIVLSQPAAGLMTATIRGVELSLVGGEYVRTGYTGMTVLTLRFLTSCSIGGGCDAFGLHSSARQERIAAFRAMDLATLSMFIASGANLDEIVTAENRQARWALLYIFANTPFADGDHPGIARMSLMVSSGADANVRGVNNFVMLHYAALESDEQLRPLEALLAMEGISVNLTNNAGQTPLDRLASFYAVFGDDARLEENARLLREAGGRCITQTNTTICGAP